MEMGLKYSQGLLLLVVASLAAAAIAGENAPTIATTQRWWNWGFNYTGWYFRHLNATNSGPARVMVGGDSHWRLGINYTEWAIKNGPLYLNDTLVFKYDPPVDNTSHPHSVYLLPTYWSFLNCDFRGARRVANTSQGGGEGFGFRLRTWRPHYFACGESQGFHCKSGMKFIVMPLFRPWHY